VKRVYPTTDFGIEIQIQLKRLRMTQTDLAKTMKVSTSYITEILRGTRASENARRKICEAVGLDYDQLIKQLEEKEDVRA